MNTDQQRYVTCLLSMGFKQQSNIHGKRSTEKLFCIEIRPDGDTEVYAIPCVSAVFSNEGQFKYFC